MKIGDKVRTASLGLGIIVRNPDAHSDGLVDSDGDLRIDFSGFETWRHVSEVEFLEEPEPETINPKDIKVGDRIRVEQSYTTSEDKAVYEGKVTVVYDHGSISTENYYFSDGVPYTYTLVNRAEPDPKVEAAVQALVALGLTESQARDKVKEIA